MTPLELLCCLKSPLGRLKDGACWVREQSKGIFIEGRPSAASRLLEATWELTLVVYTFFPQVNESSKGKNQKLSILEHIYNILHMMMVTVVSPYNIMTYCNTLFTMPISTTKGVLKGHSKKFVLAMFDPLYPILDQSPKNAELGQSCEKVGSFDIQLVSTKA